LAVKTKKNDSPSFIKDWEKGWDESGQRWAHGAQQLADFGDSINQYLFGAKAADWTPTGIFRAIGQNYRGDPRSQDELDRLNDASRRDSTAGRSSRRQNSQPAAQRPDTSPLTFADYLRMANEMGLGGGGTDFGALEAQLRQNAANADAKLTAMYNQLRGSIDADASTIGQTYDTGAQGLQQSAEQAQATINNAYQAARDAQTQQFQQLGIGDAAGVLAAQGGNAAADQANAIGNIAQNSGANQQQLDQNRTSALTYNTNIGNAAGLEGAIQRAAVQQELANRLAELQTQQSQEGSQRQQSLFQAALGMAQNPGIFDPNYQGDPMDSLKAQLLAAQVTAQDLKNQGLAANSSSQIGGNLSQYQTLAQAYGIDPSDQEAFLNFIKLVNETQ
jgi:hypothetical protein